MSKGFHLSCISKLSSAFIDFIKNADIIAMEIMDKFYTIKSRFSEIAAFVREKLLRKNL